MLQVLVAQGLCAAAACSRLAGAALAPHFYAGLSTSAVPSRDKKAKNPSFRVPSAYNLFIKQNFAEIKAATVGGKATDVMKAAGAKYKTLSDSAKAPYVSEAQRLRAGPDAQRALIKEQNKLKMGSYARFVMMNFAKGKAMASGSKSMADVSPHLSSMWKALSEKEKEAYKKVPVPPK